MKKEMAVHGGSNRGIDLFTIIFVALPCIMVKTSNSEQQAALVSAMELYFATSVVVQEDPEPMYETSSDKIMRCDNLCMIRNTERYRKRRNDEAIECP